MKTVKCNARMKNGLFFYWKNNNKLMRSIHENIESKTIYLKLRKLSAFELVLKLHHWAVVYMFLNVL